MTTPSSADNPLSPDTRQRLQAVRNAVLQLHKIIMEAEKQNYVKVNGPIASPHAFLQLVMHDPWFGWLHPLSEMVVQIDEMLDGRNSNPSEPDGQATLREVRSLLMPTEEGEEFGVKYLKVMQNHPDIILMHAEIEKLL